MADRKEYDTAFRTSGTRKRLVISFANPAITLTDADIVTESMEISESLCSGQELRFGSCEASDFKLRIIGNVIPLQGETFSVAMYVGNLPELYELGTYKVASDKPTGDRRFRDIVAYDFMHDIITADVTDWYNAVLPGEDSTITLRAFRDSFMEHFGIACEEVVLPNDGMTVERTINPDTISGLKVLKAICEINGCFGHMGRNGKIRYVTLEEIISGVYPRNDLFPSDNSYPAEHSGTEPIARTEYISCQYEDFKTQKISKLQIRQEENDIGCIIGDGDNCYVVEDNFLVYGKSAEELREIGQRLYDTIRVVSYRPATVKAIGNPCLEVGAGIRVYTKNEIVETYILERTLKGSQSLTDSYEAQGKEKYSGNVNSVERSIVQLKGKLNILTRTEEETRSQLIDVEKDLKSEITQTASEIRSEVSGADGALYSEIVETAKAIRMEVGDLSKGVYSEITELANRISLCVTSGEVRSMIDITLDSIVLEADQINLNGYVSAGDGNFTIDENGNLKIKGPYCTVDIENGVRVSSSVDGNDYITSYGSHAIWFRANGLSMARIMYDVTTDTLSINHLGGGKVAIDGGIPITTANKDEYIGTVLNSSDTRISYTSVGNINIMSTNGYKAEDDYKYGNIASTGWVQGKVATLNDAIDKLFNDFAAFDQRLSTLEAKVV